MAAAQGVCLNHIARESPDIKRLAKFYQEILGFEVLEGPKFDIDVMFLSLPPFFSIHLIERDSSFNLPERQWPFTDPMTLGRGPHLAFSISNIDSFLQLLKEKGIEYSEIDRFDGKRQIFFFDPDGNGLEVGSYEAAYNP